SLAVRSFAQYGVEGLKDVLVGPCAVAYGGDNIVDLAKTLADWEKKLDKMEVKGGYMEGQVLDGVQAKAVAKMKTRVELQGEVIMLAKSPGSRLASAINSPASTIAGCIKTIIDNQEEAA
ncbi:MAG: 50S ribosomal protein L10, partial [Phycisphaerae bacterium]|nr:50S ribosomal protein L10 [Phycisphaerae bacterium]